MNFWEFVIRRKTLISMLFIGLTLLGYVSYTRLQVEDMPSVEQPYLIVQIRANTAMAPEYIEQQAAIPVEGAIGTLEGIEEISTTIDQQSARITVNYNSFTDIRYAQIKLQQVVDQVSTTLPDEYTVSVQSVNEESLANEFMSLEVRGAGGLERIRKIVDDSIADELANIDGIATIDVQGGIEQAVEIVLHEDALDGYGITPQTVRNLINQNQEQKTYLGQGVDANRNVAFNLLANYTNVRDIGNLIIQTEGPIYVRDVASVYFGEKERTSISRVNGMESITISLVRDNQTNLIDLSNRTKAVINELNRKLVDLEMEIAVVSNAADSVEENIGLIVNLALIGGMFAVVVLWFFLNNIRLVAILMVAIPISVYTAFNLFYAYGITINSLTLVGIALAIGMLLDNSIVVLENIYRHMAHKRDIDTSVVRGTSEVWRALFASTLTTVTVFVPFLFSSDFNTRLLGRHIGISIISTLIVSLLVALLLVPMIAHTVLMRKSARKSTLFANVSQRNRMYQVYTVLLKSAMRFPARTIIGSTIVFFLSIILCINLSLDVPREVDTSGLEIFVEMPSGSTLDATDDVALEIEELIADIEEIETVTTKVYEEEANITLSFKDDYEDINGNSYNMLSDIIEDRTDNIRTADIEFGTASSGSSRYSTSGAGGMGQMQSFNRMFGIGTLEDRVVVKGEDFDMLVTVANAIKYQLDQLETLSGEARVSSANETTELRLMLDNRLLSLLDISMNTISSDISSYQSNQNTNTSSSSSSATATYQQGNETYDIIISTVESDEEVEEVQQYQMTLDDLRQVPISDADGAVHPLENLGTFRYATAKRSIERTNQEKHVEVTFGYTDDITESKTYLQLARDEIASLISSLAIDPGVAVEIVYDKPQLSEFVYLIGAAFVLIFMILASVFESVTTPVVMMFTIPLAGIGAFWALMITGNSINNANALIGLLILLGVVVNNGIILIDYTRILRSRGYSRSRALMSAGQARVRPILITATTTVVAMIPLAMGNTGQISQIGAPFAITVIGGLSMSTLFTLIFLPTVYAAFESALEWFRGLNWKLKAIQYVAFLYGFWYIYNNVSSLIWQVADTIALLALIPATVYFLMTTLRQANPDAIVPKGAKLVITVRRLVKIYDDFSRFVREWNKGKRMRKILGDEPHSSTIRVFSVWRWQIPLLVFMCYFTYIYLFNHFWQFALSHIIYIYLFMLLHPLELFAESRTGTLIGRLPGLFKKVVTWGFPVLNLVIYYYLGFQWLTIVFIILFWGVPMIIAVTSSHVHRHSINIMRLTGKFAGLRSRWYQLVMAIPIIGRKRRPFKALNTVSLEIGSGMFGLLGPNGAGKSTIMRVICGILEQSMGKLYINGINVGENREEVQGLIGYLPQEFGMYENMSAYEFLDYLAILKNITDGEVRRRRIEYVIKSVHLWEVRDKKIGSFSGGMKQRVGIALTLLHLPRILVVDEPTAGLDPRERIRFRNLLVELSSERIVLFSTHIIEDISSSCNRVAVMYRGNLQYHGEPVAMTKFAEGKVWQVSVPLSSFEQIRSELKIVHHMQVGQEIRIRCIADAPPLEGALSVKPTLEDAYLCLLSDKFIPMEQQYMGGTA